MKRYTYLLAILAPLLLGFLASGLFASELLPNLLYVGAIQMDFAGLFSRLGLLASLGVALVVATLWWKNSQVEAARTETRAAETESRRRFLRRLDHELKNPLTIIRLGIVNLQQGPNLSETQISSLQRIGQQADRLQRLVVDLRWLAGLEEHVLEDTAVDLKTLLQEVVDLMGDTPGYERRAIELSLQQVPWPVSSVAGDRDLLTLLFRNLLDNALKYTEPGDQVAIRASEDGRTAVVEVADTGPGIPEQELPLIFEELYRGATARGIPGSGLGLVLVRRIIRLHGGSIDIRTRVGQGTVMVVRLPLAQQDA